MTHKNTRRMASHQKNTSFCCARGLPFDGELFCWGHSDNGVLWEGTMASKGRCCNSIKRRLLLIRGQNSARGCNCNSTVALAAESRDSIFYGMPRTGELQINTFLTANGLKEQKGPYKRWVALDSEWDCRLKPITFFALYARTQFKRYSLQKVWTMG